MIGVTIKEKKLWTGKIKIVLIYSIIKVFIGAKVKTKINMQKTPF